MKALRTSLLGIIIACAGLVTVAIGVEDEGQEGPPPSEVWTSPECNHVMGTDVVTFTTDEGFSLARTRFLRDKNYTFGLVTLDTPNTLVAIQWWDGVGVLIRSEDAGCHWRVVGQMPICKPVQFTAGPDETIYAWYNADSVFYRIRGAVVTPLVAPNAIYGLAVNPRDAANLRVGSFDCQIYESRDSGASFFSVGGPANTWNNSFYTVNFDPLNWDCALCGSIGAWRTTDAGKTWNTVPPFDKAEGEPVFRFAYSPADARRVWARSYLETGEGKESVILVSDDGGANFRVALGEGRIVMDQNGIERKFDLSNAPIMATHPRNADVLYSMSFLTWENYGTDFWKYELAGDQLSVNHIEDLDGISAMVFNPVDPSVIYLGLQELVLDPPSEKTAGLEIDRKVTVEAVPNPFNPDTEIRFNLPAASQVKLAIYNISGQRIATLVDQYLPAGEHAAVWNGSEYASGIYLYRLEAGETAVTKKMVLVK